MLGKKREREETNSSNPALALAPEDDEEESKSKVVQKRPRLDPFASSKKKGKGLNGLAIVPPHKLAGSPPAFEPKPEKEKVVATPAEVGDSPVPSSSKNTLDMTSPPK